MKLAISNIGWDSKCDQEVYKLMQRYGFQGLEIAPTRLIPENPYCDYEKIKQVREEIRVNGFEIPSLQSIWYGRKENIFRSSEERQSLIDYTKQAILFAEMVGATNLVFGCPRNRNIETTDLCIGEVEREFFYEIGEYAKIHHTVIGMEANPAIYHTNYVNTTEEAIALIRRVKSEGFRLNVDFGTIIQNNESLEILENNLDLINHVHISEPGLKLIQKREEHKQLARILKDAKYKGFVSIEMGMQESLRDIEEAIRYIKEIFGD